MLYMNDYEIDQAIRLHSATIHTEDILALNGALVLRNLAEWANANSDGWAYWPKPARAAAKLMTLLQERERRYRDGGIDADQGVTRGELAAAITPIKAFLTRQGVPAATKDAILGPVL
jgi:hypothetical protein